MRRNILCIVLSFLLIMLSSPKAAAVSLAGLSAKSAILIDAQTGTIIAGKNEYQMLPMASTTKIMSALLLLESGDLDSKFKVDNQAIRVEGSSMGLCEDDIVTKRALCYGMLLPSGNDAANQTAVLLGGSAEGFAEMMNERAEKIGMNNTNFVTPSGLHDPNHYSTAYDMSLLAREALKNETFSEICSTQKAKLEFGNPPYERWLVNTNKLLSKYEGCIGVKTGFTDEAGRCLVSAAEKNGVTLICVTLNAPDDWNDHIKMYDYGFSVAEKKTVDFDYSNLKVNVAGGTVTELSLVPETIPEYTSVNGNLLEFKAEVIVDKFVYAPVAKGKKVGAINFYNDGELIVSSALNVQYGCDAVVTEYRPNFYDKIIEWIKKFL